MSPFQLQQWLGHANLNTTQIYVHLGKQKMPKDYAGHKFSMRYRYNREIDTDSHPPGALSKPGWTISPSFLPVCWD